MYNTQSNTARNGHRFSAGINSFLVNVWVVELDVISVWGIGVDLISVLAV